jgi:DNA polymerase III epsilon subunit-like protein
MRDFAAIDFETANNERTSVCSVGIVVVRNGEIADSFYSLIQPEPTTIIIGTRRYTDLLVRIPKRRLSFLKYGKKLNRLLRGCHSLLITSRSMSRA